MGAAHGILADLGVSSPQLDDGARGFSFMRDGVVDMRMNPNQGQSVGQWLSCAHEDEIADVLYQYGDERHSRRIARAIKNLGDYSSTLKLAEAIKQAHPNWQKGKHPATKSFSALRIFINQEMDDLRTLLNDAPDVLVDGGVFAVISFHSLEDRMVKNAMRDLKARGFSKMIRIDPSDDETRQNPRARSSHLRVVIKGGKGSKGGARG